MGNRGTALFASGNTSVIRDDFRSIARAPWDGARIAEYLLDRFPSGRSPGDGEYTDVQLAMADLFWQYGIRHEPTLERAARIVEDGEDIEAKRLLGMAEAELERRRKILEELRDKWTKPNPKPRHRRMLISPEPFLFETGDCLCYPTSQGHVIDPRVSGKGRAHAPVTWKQDGWGAAIVLHTFRRFDVFARYLIAVLDCCDRWKPSLDHFPRMNILHIEERGLPNEADAVPAIRVHSVHATEQQLRRMRVHTLGGFIVDAERVAADYDLGAPPFSCGESDFADVTARTLDARENTWVDFPASRYLR